MNKEKLNYLKNKISMELKNPVTQQGFEIICKRLSELEKENAELKRQLEEITKDRDGWKQFAIDHYGDF